MIEASTGVPRDRYRFLSTLTYLVRPLQEGQDFEALAGGIVLQEFFSLKRGISCFPLSWCTSFFSRVNKCYKKRGSAC